MAYLIINRHIKANSCHILSQTKQQILTLAFFYFEISYQEESLITQDSLYNA